MLRVHCEWLLMVVHFSCFSEAAVCEPAMDGCKSKFDDGNPYGPKRGRVLLQRRLQGMQSKLDDKIGNNETMLAPSSATIAEATPQLLDERPKKCYRFETVARSHYSMEVPNGWANILEYAGVKHKPNAASNYKHNYAGDHWVTYRDRYNRNACIVYNANYSKSSVQHYQGMSDLENQGVAAGILTLMAHGYSEHSLRAMTEDDQRNTLIVRYAKCVGYNKDESYYASNYHARNNRRKYIEDLQERYNTWSIANFLNVDVRCCDCGKAVKYDRCKLVCAVGVVCK